MRMPSSSKVHSYRMEFDKLIHGKTRSVVLVLDFDSANTTTGMFESQGFAAIVPVSDKDSAEMNIRLTHEM